MKKIILTLVFVFAMGMFNSLNASNNLFIEKAELSCIEKAWNFGTFMGIGDPEKEYRMTDYYYRKYCL